MIEALADSLVLLQNVSGEVAQEIATTEGNAMTNAAAAIGVGLAAIGAGYAERGIGSAAVGAMAEDPSMFGRGLLMTVLPETLVIFAIVVIFLVGV